MISDRAGRGEWLLGRARKIQAEGPGTKCGKRRDESKQKKPQGGLKRRVIKTGMFYLETKTEPYPKIHVRWAIGCESREALGKTAFTFHLLH